MGDEPKTPVQQLLEHVQPKRDALEKPKRRPSTPPRSRERSREAMHEMSKSGDWEDANGHHLVALYEYLHEQVYGVPTSELDAKSWANAALTASRMVNNQFRGDYEEAVKFMVWLWKRERSREKWRRENGKSGSRVGWRLQFGSGELVTDFRLDSARRRHPSGT